MDRSSRVHLTCTADARGVGLLASLTVFIFCHELEICYYTCANNSPGTIPSRYTCRYKVTPKQME